MTRVLLSLATLSVVAPTIAQVRPLDPAVLLEAYSAGRFDEALAPVQRATRIQARELRQLIPVKGAQWVDAAGADRSRRALAAAAFALEVERIRAEGGEWSPSDERECAGRCVIEWGCTLLQSRGAPDEGERIWMLASIALAGGVRDWFFLQAPLSRPSARTGEEGHVHHAIARLPDEARFRLARAVALASRHMVTSEMGTPRDGTGMPPGVDGFVRLRDRALILAALEQRRTAGIDYAREQLEALLPDASVGAEARMRLGYLYWVTGHGEDALAAQTAAADAARDPELKYLANFLAAQTAQALGDLRAAEAHYNAALGARPHSQSATLGLAALLYVRGEGQKAYELVEASRTGRPRDDDPWRMFLYGDFARLPMLVGELRRQVKP